MVKIVPAILATNEEEYKEKLDKVEQSNLFGNSWIQIDFMDNKFVQNKSVGPQILQKYPTELQTEAHLMVDYPEDFIDELIKGNISRIICPVEDQAGTSERLNHVKNHGVLFGLSVNPKTSVETIKEYLGEIDVCLIMSVQPGFGGQEFLPEALEKVKELARLKVENNLNFLIGVDGGINEEVAGSLARNGADYLVIGSHLLEGNINENIEKIKIAIN